MDDQDMFTELKRILELTSRVEERVNAMIETNKDMSNQFAAFIEQKSILSQRIAKVETILENFNENRIITNKETIGIKKAIKKVVIRIMAVENSVPIALKIVNESIEALNKLTSRIEKVESNLNEQNRTVKSWKGWLTWIGEWLLKLSWLIIGGYITYLLAK